jgi:hypothetical protein
VRVSMRRNVASVFGVARSGKHQVKA